MRQEAALAPPDLMWRQGKHLEYRSWCQPAHTHGQSAYAAVPPHTCRRHMTDDACLAGHPIEYVVNYCRHCTRCNCGGLQCNYCIRSPYWIHTTFSHRQQHADAASKHKTGLVHNLMLSVPLQRTTSDNVEPVRHAEAHSCSSSSVIHSLKSRTYCMLPCCS